MSVVVGAPDANALAAFYGLLLGWSPVDDQPGWVKLVPPAGHPFCLFESTPQ